MRVALVGAGLLLGLASGPLAAQGNPAWIPEGTALGITVDRFAFGSENHVHAATFHVSTLRSNRLTPEFDASLFPSSLRAGVVVTNLDLGGAINLSLPHVTLLLRGGASGLFAFGTATGALPGAHYGASLLVRIEERSGFRIDVLRRVYFLPYELTPPMFSIGVGITSLPGIPGPRQRTYHGSTEPTEGRTESVP
jgi:hypothetical protein